VHRVSVEEYHRMGALGMLDKSHELLRGYVVKKMPKSPLHVRILQKLLMLLVRSIPGGMFVRPEQPLTIGDSEPEPDLSVVRGEPDDWAERHPATAELVVEISVSTLEVDVEKAGIYAEAGVPEYWLVRPEQAEVDVYRSPADGRYMEKLTLRGADTLRCGSIAAVEVKLGELFGVRA
jgi:Uma2 family endonuclease